MAYLLYKSNDNVTPFVIVNDNTIDNTTTSVFLVGKRKESYGQPMQQGVLWMLENFANGTPPVNAVLGQAWFNTSDEKLYVCVDEGAQAFEKVSNSLVSGTAPVSNLSEGDLWFDSVNDRLYVWNGTTWVLVGPQNNVPVTVETASFMNRVTTNATPSELWLNGITNSRLVIPVNTTWNFEIRLSARRTNAAGEAFGAIFRGVLNRDAGVPAIVNGGVQTEINAQSVGFNPSIAISADTTYNSLKIEATGEAAKIVEWNATVKLTISDN